MHQAETLPAGPVHISLKASLQTTLLRPVSRKGVGIHSGASSRVTLRPAPADTGIVFVLCACPGTPRLPARPELVTSTRRCTALGVGEARLDTVEHLLSALFGLRVDNALVEVHGPELPILDGSAQPWVEAVREAGLDSLEKTFRALTLRETVALRDGDSWLVATPSDRFSATCVTHFDHPLLGTQAASFRENADDYAAQIAPARTFGFIEEVEALLAGGLAGGGTLENALVVYPDHFSTPLRMPEECARHKLLDLLGDLALAGIRLRAAVTAVKPGHKINAAFAALLANKVE